MNLTINLADPEEVAIALDMLQRIAGDQEPPAPAPTPAPASTPAPAKTDEPITLEQLRATGGKAAAKDKKAMREAVKKFGANLSEIAESDYPALMAVFEEIIDA